MKKLLLLFILPAFLSGSALFSQPATLLTWWNPANSRLPVIEGQGWPGETEEPFDRLPLRAKELVRKPVWSLSKESAGLVIRFRSNAGRIVVRYGVSGGFAMPHMPATGVSGIDMYAVDSDGRWLWCKGRYSFGDTITYRFSGIRPNDGYHKKGREYRLYLPLYNHIRWLEIGVPVQTLFTPLPLRSEKPIVFYGTSIAQGACASRPGMAWGNILERRLDRPVINLGFSGNGRLEKELISLMNETDAKLYILDCMPNMTAPRFTGEEVQQRIIKSVKSLHEKHPDTPVLLVEHDGYPDGAIMPAREKNYTDINRVMEKTLVLLKTQGEKNIYLLTKAEINQDINTMVDGVHATDAGMLRYADAYEKIIRHILAEPAGHLPTTKPCTQYREPDNYDWELRHHDILKQNKTSPPRIVFLGNSIVHYWGGVPGAPFSRGAYSWDKYLVSHGVCNFGFGWDRIENVLWRINHDELDGYRAKQVLLLMATNNLQRNSEKEILKGLALLVKDIKAHQPGADILVLGILPRRNNEEKIARLNISLSQIAGMLNTGFADIGQPLLGNNGEINEALFVDGLHPNAKGYELLARQLQPLLK